MENTINIPIVEMTGILDSEWSYRPVGGTLREQWGKNYMSTIDVRVYYTMS